MSNGVNIYIKLCHNHLASKQVYKECSTDNQNLLLILEMRNLSVSYGIYAALYIYKSSSAFTIPKINTKWTKIIYLYLMRADLEA